MGLIFATEPAAREVRAGPFFNATLHVPAGASNAAVETDAEFLEGRDREGIFPHTHVRGKK